MTNESDLSTQIRDFIVSEVRDHWSQTGKTFLLSNLGSRVRMAFPDCMTAMPDGLTRFLASWPVVQLVRHPRIRPKIGAVPLEVKIPIDPTELFDAPHRAPLDSSRPHFIPDFWRAFHTLINGRRFVLLPSVDHPAVRIVDIPDVEPEPEGYEILRTDLSILPREAPLDDKVRLTTKKIDDWLLRHSLSPDLFLDAAMRPRPPTLESADRRQHASSLVEPRGRPSLSETGEIVALALSKLDQADQARIFVPLDVVVKMILGLR
jgi:hypothetical protein